MDQDSVSTTNEGALVKKFILHTLKLLVVFISLYYLYRTIYPDLIKLQAFEFSLKILLLITGGLIIYGLFFTVKIVLWFKILRHLGTSVNFSRASGIWFGSQIIKYIPGKIWFIVSRVYFARKLMSRSRILIATFLEMILMLISPVLVFNLSNGSKILKNINISSYANIAILISTLLCLVGLHPFFLQKILNFFTRIFKSRQFFISFQYSMILKLLLLYCLNWFLYGLANYLILAAFLPFWPEMFFQITAVFAIAYVLAFLSLITPGGIGVKEAIQVYLLTRMGCPGTIAVAASVISRLIWNFYELLGGLIFVGLKGLLSMRKNIVESAPEK